MSGSNECRRSTGLTGFAKDDGAWADFFLSKVGLIIFAAVLLLAAFRAYSVFDERDAKAQLDAVTSDIASKIEAVDSTMISGYSYRYDFDDEKRDVMIEISTEYVVARKNLSNMGRTGRQIVHAEPMMTRVYPSNSKWDSTSGLREYLSKEIEGGRNGDFSSPLDLQKDIGKVEKMFDDIRDELARTPFVPDRNKPLIIEKVIIYYSGQSGPVGRDYVIVYQ